MSAELTIGSRRAIRLGVRHGLIEALGETLGTAAAHEVVQVRGVRLGVLVDLELAIARCDGGYQRGPRSQSASPNGWVAHCGTGAAFSGRGLPLAAVQGGLLKPLDRGMDA